MNDTTRTGTVRARRNLRLLWAGVLAICLGGLGAAGLYLSVADTHSVVAVKRTVFRDQLITAEDLTVISLATVPGLETVAAERITEVVGTSALTDLVEGGVLSPRSFGAPPLEVGKVRLGLKLAPGRMPAGALPPGTEVLLVAVARTAPDGSDLTPEASVTGRVASLPEALPDGSAVLDVVVPDGEAERVARLAAADRLVLVRQAGGPR
jgi:hypothetical protein